MNQLLSVRQVKQTLRSGERQGFTLIELLIVTALIGVISAILLTALSRARLRAQAIVCLNNTRNLVQGWHNISEDNEGKLAYNVGPDGLTPNQLASIGEDPDSANWVNNKNVLDWELTEANTNLAYVMGKSALGPYVGNPNVYRCPADNVLSGLQLGAQWENRNRSYSINAMVGDAGLVSASGQNSDNPGYQQYFKYTSIQQPAEIFVFLDEHPDSIKDGYFLNAANPNERNLRGRWQSLPANYHNGASAMAFADLHCELHRWVCGSTLRPNRPGGAGLPLAIPSTEQEDFRWIMKHSSERSY